MNEYIKENYDTEHTLSFNDAVDDLTLIASWGKYHEETG